MVYNITHNAEYNIRGRSYIIRTVVLIHFYCYIMLTTSDVGPALEELYHSVV